MSVVSTLSRRSHPFNTSITSEMYHQQADTNVNLDKSPKEGNCYQCDHCGGRFKTKRTLKRHKDRKDCDQPFHCEGCSRNFKLEAMAKNHMKYCAGISHKCTMCGKELRTETQMRWHMELHTDSNAFSCDVCGNKFTRPADLRVHKKNVHGGAEDYVCETCGDIFNNPSSLKGHKNIHLGVEVFQCGCGKAFKRKDRLQRHSAVHLSVETHFSCPVCHKTFARVDNLKIHCESHRNNAFPCPECEFSFSTLKKLWSHIDESHATKEFQV